MAIFSCMNIFAQKGYAEKTNQLNDRGHKEGLWQEVVHTYWRTETYYKDGIKSGIFREYNTKGELTCFGEYTDNYISGTWYYFGDYGHLMSIQKDFSVNTDTVILDSKKQYVYPHKCYMISYHPNGIIKDEGVLLWNEDPELDDTREYGEWKYYDESGELIKTKLFK